MSNDRELLELAAKAAGVPLSWPYDPATYARFDGVPPRRTDTWENWSPLTDDGDALRLAVKLDLSSLMVFSYPGSDKRREFWSPNSGTDGGRSATTEADYTADPYAATRRAIVRAAAEIGKGMT